MTDQEQQEAYNYRIFEGREDFAAFRTHLQIGASAPNFSATLLETGKNVMLSDYWQGQELVIEFGSHT